MNKVKRLFRWTVTLAIVCMLLAGTVTAVNAEQIFFSDVASADWSYEYVLQAYTDGIMNGT